MSLKPLVILSSASFVFFLLFLKRRQQSAMKYCTIEKSLRGQIVLITGASAGLGKLVFQHLRLNKSKVIVSYDLSKFLVDYYNNVKSSRWVKKSENCPIVKIEWNV